MTRSALAREVIEELDALPARQLRELRAYVFFLKTCMTVDPTQLYFWTKRWQAWEREADADKRTGRVVGDGTIQGLLTALRRR